MTGSRPDSWTATPKMSNSINQSDQIDPCKYLVCLLAQNIHKVTMAYVRLLQLRVLDLLARHRAGSMGRWKAVSTRMRPPSPYRTLIPTWKPTVALGSARYSRNTCWKVRPDSGRKHVAQKSQFRRRYNGQEGDHHHHLSTAIDRVTKKPHETQLGVSQLFLVVEK